MENIFHRKMMQAKKRHFCDVGKKMKKGKRRLFSCAEEGEERLLRQMKNDLGFFFLQRAI